MGTLHITITAHSDGHTKTHYRSEDLRGDEVPALLVHCIEGMEEELDRVSRCSANRGKVTALTRNMVAAGERRYP